MHIDGSIDSTCYSHASTLDCNIISWLFLAARNITNKRTFPLRHHAALDCICSLVDDWKIDKLPFDGEHRFIARCENVCLAWVSGVVNTSLLVPIGANTHLTRRVDPALGAVPTCQ